MKNGLIASVDTTITERHTVSRSSRQSSYTATSSTQPKKIDTERTAVSLVPRKWIAVFTNTNISGGCSCDGPCRTLGHDFRASKCVDTSSSQSEHSRETC